MFKLFTKHPYSVNETYLQHAYFALSIAVKMILAGMACMLHAFFPFLFVTTASDTIKKIHVAMTKRCEKADCVQQENKRR